MTTGAIMGPKSILFLSWLIKLFLLHKALVMSVTALPPTLSKHQLTGETRKRLQFLIQLFQRYLCIEFNRELSLCVCVCVCACVYVVFLQTFCQGDLSKNNQACQRQMRSGCSNQRHH